MLHRCATRELLTQADSGYIQRDARKDPILRALWIVAEEKRLRGSLRLLVITSSSDELC